MIDRGPLRFLLADDSEIIHELFRAFATHFNVDALSAYDGQQALKLMATQHVDLLILDLKMPIMTGHQLLQERVKSQESYAIPVFVISGDALSEQFYELTGLGVSDYFTKPVDWMALFERALKIVERHKPNQ